MNRHLILARPLLYVGRPWDAAAVHWLALEIARQAADPAHGNQSTQVVLTVRPDGGLMISDDGRGLPTDTRRPWENGALVGPALELVLTVILERHPTPAFHAAYGYLDYLGCVLAAVAARLEIITHNTEGCFRVVAAQGEITEPLHALPTADGRGTQLTFWPDPTVVPDFVWDQAKLAAGVHQLAQRYPVVRFLLHA